MGFSNVLDDALAALVADAQIRDGRHAPLIRRFLEVEIRDFKVRVRLQRVVIQRKVVRELRVPHHRGGTALKVGLLLLVLLIRLVSAHLLELMARDLVVVEKQPQAVLGFGVVVLPLCGLVVERSCLQIVLRQNNLPRLSLAGALDPDALLIEKSELDLRPGVALVSGLFEPIEGLGKALCDLLAAEALLIGVERDHAELVLRFRMPLVRGLLIQLLRFLPILNNPQTTHIHRG